LAKVVVVTRKGDTAAHFEAAVGTTGIAVGIVMTLHLNQKRARAACGLRLLFDGQAVVRARTLEKHLEPISQMA
jgi:hypothetical protein